MVPDFCRYKKQLFYFKKSNTRKSVGEINKTNLSDFVLSASGNEKTECAVRKYFWLCYFLKTI